MSHGTWLVFLLQGCDPDKNFDEMSQKMAEEDTAFVASDLDTPSGGDALRGDSWGFFEPDSDIVDNAQNRGDGAIDTDSNERVPDSDPSGSLLSFEFSAFEFEEQTDGTIDLDAHFDGTSLLIVHQGVLARCNEQWEDTTTSFVADSFVVNYNHMFSEECLFTLSYTIDLSNEMLSGQLQEGSIYRVVVGNMDTYFSYEPPSYE